MTKKQSLKKNIHLICEELLAECIAAMTYGDNNTENGQALLFSIIKMQDDYISRISHPEPGMSAKQYYKTLRENFASQASELIDQINN